MEREDSWPISWPFGKNNDGSCGGCRGSADKGQIFRIISRYLGLRWWSFKRRKWRPRKRLQREEGKLTPPPPHPNAFTYRRGGYRIGNIRRISTDRSERRILSLSSCSGSRWEEGVGWMEDEIDGEREREREKSVRP